MGGGIQSVPLNLSSHLFHPKIRRGLHQSFFLYKENFCINWFSAPRYIEPPSPKPTKTNSTDREHTVPSVCAVCFFLSMQPATHSAAEEWSKCLLPLLSLIIESDSDRLIYYRDWERIRTGNAANRHRCRNGSCTHTQASHCPLSVHLCSPGAAAGIHNLCPG